MVEEKTGKSVQLMQDENLPVLATLQMARHGAGFHILRYKPTNEPLDYLITFQAGYALRLYDTPPEQRFDLTSTNEAVEKAKILLKNNHPTADNTLIEEFALQLSNWALMSLRSIPVGMRIDHWIRRTYPDLHTLQDASLALQQQQNVSLLSMNLQGITVTNQLLVGLAAYALFVDDMTGQNTYAIPYGASGLIEQGRGLMKVWRNTTDHPELDCFLIDAWALSMGIRDWYTWQRFQP